METIAVYWEPRIKTYGFQKVTGLAILEIACPVHAVESLVEILTRDDLHTVTAPFILAQESSHELSFLFCLPEREGEDLRASLEQASVVTSHRYLYPVGIIFFHGPHFGDRYGIADSAFSALLKAGIETIASGCSSSSVYLVIDQDDIHRAEEVLTEAFEVAT